MNLVPADTYSIEQLAALFTAGYEGYFVPFRVDAAQLTAMIEAWNHDLARSRVAVRDGDPVGFALLATRGDRGWIGGVGVVKHERRNGIGRAAMEAVLADAPSVVGLEVIEQNEPAIRLYESLGFERTRLLEVWSLAADVPAVDVRHADPSPTGEPDTPWQREDASLRPGYERLEVDGGAAAIRCADGQVSILQLRADDDESARLLIAAARARGDSVRFVNIPEGHPASSAFAALGGKLDLRQYEMRLERS